MNLFKSADILLPKTTEPEKWAVIACDQFTSQPEYWDRAEAIASGSPSALKLILPEARLSSDNSALIADINRHMSEYLANDIFTEYKSSYIYVERTLMDGSIRRGILGVLDLESYDPAPDSVSPTRASERTVLERIPPRVQIRKDAGLELPHTLVLCDDKEDLILGCACTMKPSLPLVYDFELMLGGGHIRAWLLSGVAADAVDSAVAEYSAAVTARYAQFGLPPVLFAMGDGNHSFATAKACWETLKTSDPAIDRENHPARYSLVELENIHDEAQKFEPIHRVVTGTDTTALISALKAAVSGESGVPMHWYAGENSGEIIVDTSSGQLPVALIQSFLDEYLISNAGNIDYIHGESTVIELSKPENCVGLILPPVDKNGFFMGISAGGVLPRKTFSMGHAEEKRYYIEARRIR